MKKQLLIIVPVLAFSTLGAASCSNTDNGPKFVPEVINYERISKVQRSGYYLLPGEERTIEINYTSYGKNYLKLDVYTTIDVYGTFNYENLEDFNETGRESFFVPAGEEKQEYKHFLDAYRPDVNDHRGCSSTKGVHPYYNMPMETKMAQGDFDKEITHMTIKNISNEPGEVRIYGLYISDRVLPREEIYLSNGTIKIGADLMGGGTFTYLERLHYKTSKNTYYIDEVLTADNDVYIGVNAQKIVDEEDGLLGSEDHHVNLINYYDAGRQFQQSFYANVGGTTSNANGANGYQRSMCYTATPEGYYWPYNPVQGGDVHCNISQIIDYSISEDTIYVKAKPLDWAHNNSVTDSYMENWYSIKNDCVYVKNNFVNFAGFTDMDKCDKSQLELPAAYIVHPFNTYVTYQGESPWTEDQTGLVYNPNLSSWAAGADIVTKHPEDWFAWVNSDKFGVGVYIPEVSFYASGRSSTSINFSDSLNQDAFTSPMGDPDQLKYNKKECTYAFQSCYTRNTCYTAPEIVTTMLDYMPFSYTYVLSVDFLPVMRNNFKNIYLNNEIDNTSMFVWDRALRNK